MKDSLAIVKIGGNIIEKDEDLDLFLTRFSALKGNKILVHGGGKKATEIGKKLGYPSKLIGGRRITDAQTLEVITMVYGGWANKNIVAKLQGLGLNAIGLSGADGNAIQAHKRPIGEIDFGFVGDVDGVDSHLINKLLQLGLVPVFCAMTHDGKGQLLNTNADTIASEMAIGMASFFDTVLFYLFEKKGVLLNVEDETSVVGNLDMDSYTEFLRKGVISDGMLPKLENCFHALRGGVSKVCVGDSTMMLPQSELFTTITL